MANIGEKLEESRKRQGISIRDAAEATKIRADFLVDFENNRFDQDLPDLYKRGFIKVYAKFLKLDAEKLAKSFNATQLGVPPQAAADSSLGRVETGNYSSHYTSGDDNADSAEGPGGIDAAVYWKIFIMLAVVIGILGHSGIPAGLTLFQDLPPSRDRCTNPSSEPVHSRSFS